ncbi:MAG TPA: phosphoribosylanthranilate isomerase [Thermoanaerobaculia bacterium]|nr:phosphoribosylanthranilate isomerase [Thermoanaerobaculia bacterium]
MTGPVTAAGPAAVDGAGAGRVAVKICGVTEPEDAVLSAELGAGYLGLNFWPGSPRFVDLGRAQEIAAAVRDYCSDRGHPSHRGLPSHRGHRSQRPAAPGVQLVGVFVNPTAAAVAETAAAVGLDLLQFSGDEPAAAVRPFAARAIKALRRHDPAAAAAHADCWAVLFDAPTADSAGNAAAGAVAATAGMEYGGTGRQWDYAAAAGAAAGAGFARVFLAGGIGPRNVRRVVATLRPFAVDVCSGVESAPGRKDPELLRQLFEEVSNGQVSHPA